MRILIIRHADPDYSIDSLTETGRKEAKALAAMAPQMNLGDCYVSPLGRARLTAEYSLAAAGKTAKVLDWLQEFPARVDLNRASAELRNAYSPVRTDPEDPDGKRLLPHGCWDMLPSYLGKHPELQDLQNWRNSEIAGCSDILKVYDHVCERLDLLLEKYGYVRNGNTYRVEHESRETITLFCHFGIAAVMLSHLINCSPFVLWHGGCLLPSSVTETVTEEREQGIASFRILRFGDTTHLTLAGRQASFAARFTEVYSDTEARH